MFRITIVAVAVFALAAGAHSAQMDYMAMQQAMEKAQADAVRRGDEKLDCEALEKEMIAIMTGPELQAYVGRASERSKTDQERLKAAQSAAAVTAPIQSAMAAFGSLAPGGDTAYMAGMQAQAMAQGPQARQRMQDQMKQAADLMTIMPQMMRAQRVAELAHTKGCDWMSASGFPGGDDGAGASPKKK